MEEQMQGERMKQLLKNASKIRGEVKTLDNDMQMLVCVLLLFTCSRTGCLPLTTARPLN